MGEVFLTSLSFIFLLQFSTRVIIAGTHSFQWLQYVLLGIGGLWLINAFLFFVLHNKDMALWLEAMETSSRYLLCFPGAALAAVGFLLQRDELMGMQTPHAKKLLYGVAISFLAYGVMEGLAVPYPEVIPAGWSGLQPAAMFSIAFMPLLRSLTAITMAYFVIRVIGLLSHEYSHLVEAVERSQVLARERERISRDLHDGVIQSLYAIGLQMEETVHLTRESPQEARRVLRQMIEGLNGVIRDIRLFIQGLSLPQSEEGHLVQRIASQLRRFSDVTQVAAEIFAPRGETVLNLAPAQIDNLCRIVQEALVNVAKHAEASQVYVVVGGGKDGLLLSISDDGKGMGMRTNDSGGLTGHGLENIRSRVAILGGRCLWESCPGWGTRLTVAVPLPPNAGR